MADRPNDLVQGTLDMLILKTLDLEPMHGFGLMLRVEQVSGVVFRPPFVAAVVKRRPAFVADDHDCSRRSPARSRNRHRAKCSGSLSVAESRKLGALSQD